MKPRMPTARKNTPTSIAALWIGERSRMPIPSIRRRREEGYGLGEQQGRERRDQRPETRERDLGAMTDEEVVEARIGHGRSRQGGEAEQRDRSGKSRDHQWIRDRLRERVLRENAEARAAVRLAQRDRLLLLAPDDLALLGRVGAARCGAARREDARGEAGGERCPRRADVLLARRGDCRG